MTHTPHTLAEEFPEKVAEIHKLKESDAHFARLVKEYDELNDQINLAEARVTPMSEFAEEDLRKKRLKIKDEIAQTLSA